MGREGTYIILGGLELRVDITQFFLKFPELSLPLQTTLECTFPVLEEPSVSLGVLIRLDHGL